jgi:AraC family transcriptional regulator of adaptative response/methylated-DNA-[protein]-cysteine methyltransferase
MSELDLIREEEMWRAVVDRDASFNGVFFFGVLTTGVFCRPSCKCRQPLRRNVRFFDNAEDAQRAGLRACLRCKPLNAADEHPAARQIRKVCEHIRAHSEEPLPLTELAQLAGLSPFHFQRSFKTVTGVTPKQYLEQCRLDALKGALRSRRSVTDAIYEAGFGSSSRVYGRADSRLGMTPGEYRAGGKGVRISYAAADCPLGRMMIGATDRGICFLQFADRDSELLDKLRREYPEAEIGAIPEPYSGDFDDWMSALREYLEDGSPRLDLPLDVRATAFQMKVWRYLQSIPAGHVESYAEVAAGIGQPAAARAVARACASNRVALVIPCHRVIRGTGELGGYRWGLERKRTLLDRERAAKGMRLSQ